MMQQTLKATVTTRQRTRTVTTRITMGPAMAALLDEDDALLMELMALHGVHVGEALFEAAQCAVKQVFGA